MSPPRVLNLGVIGLGTDWESDYAPAIAKLGTRSRVVSVFDGTLTRTQEVAASLWARPCHGVRELIASPVDAVMILDSGWYGDWLIRTAATRELPLFIGRHGRLSTAVRKELDQACKLTGALVLPEPLLRYQPSLLRLRELMAARLGRPTQVELDLPRLRTALDELITLRDILGWCHVTFSMMPASASIDRPLTSDSDSASVVLKSPTRSRQELSVHLHLGDDEGGAESLAADEAAPFGAVTCESGRVELLGDRELRWDAGEGWNPEVLGADRSATDVVIDLFARRALGGLIPVPDLTDLEAAEHLVELVTS